jgi:trigger factor
MTQTATTLQSEQTFDYPITIEDAGPAARRLTIEIPQERIAAKLAESFDELSEHATLPGFRAGKAPKALLQKRFSNDVRKQVRDELIRESYQQAMEKHSLKVIGEPQFDEREGIEHLPDTGPYTFSFSVEVVPDIALPDLGDLTIKKPVININDKHVDQALQNLREQQGTLLPADDREARAGDYLVADVSIKLEGEEVGKQDSAQIVLRPGNIGGIDVKDLAEGLSGAKVGDARSITAIAPANHPAEKIREKSVTLEFKVKDIKFLELAEIDEDFLVSLGFDNQQQLLDELRQQMVIRVDNDVKVAMHNQVKKAILERTDVPLPTRLTQQQEVRVIRKRATELMMRGMPEDQIVGNIDRVRAGAMEQARTELKLFFAISKLTEKYSIDVSEDELNDQIATMAMYSDKRPEQMRKDLQTSGRLSELFLALRERKTLDRLIQDLKVEAVSIDSADATTVDPSAKDPIEDKPSV